MQKEFDSIRTERHKQGHGRQESDSANEKKLVENCKYCYTGHLEAVSYVWQEVEMWEDE